VENGDDAGTITNHKLGQGYFFLLREVQS